MRLKFSTPSLSRSAFIMTTVVGVVLAIAYIYFPENYSNSTDEDLSKKLKTRAGGIGEAVDYLGIDVEIRNDGSALVTAAARVNATPNQIVYGISFGIPLSHLGPSGSLVTHRHRVIKGFRNGDPVRTRSFASGKKLERVYLGETKNPAKLPAGEYNFQLLYKIDNLIDHTTQLDSITDLDLIGTYWKVPIKSATVTLRFPPDVPLAEVDHSASVRSLSQGSIPAQSRLDSANQTIQFWAPYELDPLHGMSINARWPKGYIKRLGKEVYVEPEAIKKESTSS